MHQRGAVRARSDEGERGRRILSGDEAGAVRIWAAVHGRLELVLEAHHSPATAILSPDGTRIAMGAAWGATEITVCDSRSGRVVHTLRGHTGFIESLAYSREGHRLLSASKDGTARLREPRPRTG